MRRFLTRLLQSLARRFARRPAPSSGLTEIEYEAVAMIAYEGRAAYARARAQARYCRERGSETGCKFWSDVAAEIARRTKGGPLRQASPGRSE